jgi:hypothetical protein
MSGEIILPILFRQLNITVQKLTPNQMSGTYRVLNIPPRRSVRTVENNMNIVYACMSSHILLRYWITFMSECAVIWKRLINTDHRRKCVYIINITLGMTWIKMLTIYFKIVCQHLHGETDKNHEQLSKENTKHEHRRMTPVLSHSSAVSSYAMPLL